jgi:ABC-type amino acid transport substrate-binding protein
MKRASFLTLLLSAALAFVVAKYAVPQSASTAITKESAFARVMRTGTITCGYVVIPPQLGRDPNTGKLFGVGVDLTEELARRLNLKVNWAEEVSFATMTEGFNAGRYDVFCQPGYRWVPAARGMDYGEPVFYSATSAYVRADDVRFDNDLTAINDPSVRVATIDGEAGAFLRESDFPKSSATAMPQNTDISFLFEAVASGKADVVFANPLMIMPYLLSNPGKLKRIESNKPLRIHSHAFGFGKGEQDLANLFNLVMEEMLDDGTVDRILSSYEKIPDSFVRLKRRF